MEEFRDTSIKVPEGEKRPNANTQFLTAIICNGKIHFMSLNPKIRRVIPVMAVKLYFYDTAVYFEGIGFNAVPVYTPWVFAVVIIRVKFFFFFTG